MTVTNDSPRDFADCRFFAAFDIVAPSDFCYGECTMKINPELEPRNDQSRRRVLLYGESLLLGAAGATLKQDSRLETISLASPGVTPPELAALAPDVILFDVDGVRPEAALALLKARPRLVLIGIDPSTDQMQLWSGQQSRALTMQDLVEAIVPARVPNRVFARGLALIENLCRLVLSHDSNQYSKSR
jgi:hypothetical protein